MDAHQDSDGVTPEVPDLHSERPRPTVWRAWADALRRNHLGDLAALCVEALSPLAPAASQLLYASSPFLGQNAMRFARLLESDVIITDVARYLTTDETDDPLSKGVVGD